MTNTPNQEPSIALPVIAMVFFILFWPIGVILSIVSLVKYGSFKGSTAKTLSIIALVMNVGLAVPVCGIVAAIAIPNFVKFQCRSKQSEAKTNLKMLMVLQEGHRGLNAAYAPDLATVEFQPSGAVVRYTYSLLEADDMKFVAEARGIGEMAGDVWTINNTGALVNVDNVCAR
jgi:type IV pilus assembly protein PilA